jgi:ribonuclease HII
LATISQKSFDKKLKMVLLCSKFREDVHMVNQVPTFVEEEKLIAQGYRIIAGVDEVGRGPLAGPVVAAAVILPLELRPSWLSRVRDSKQLTPSQRESIFDRITESGVAYGLGVVSHEVIDKRGIASATRLAMRDAIKQLSICPDYLLIDFMQLPAVRIPQKSVVDGDSVCLSIAAASIVAKVTRDRMMVELDGQYPGYGLAQHKGYGTKEHLACLRRLGPSPLHRHSFKPVRERKGLLLNIRRPYNYRANYLPGLVPYELFHVQVKF